MPPRARKTAAKKPPPEETPTVTEEQTNEAPETVPILVHDEDAPKRRGGRKRSELAHAAREYEQADNAVHRLEARYQRMAMRLSEVGAQLAEARRVRDESWAVIEEARKAREEVAREAVAAYDESEGDGESTPADE